MQTFKCKICGGSLTVASKSRVAVCDYCGSKQILPLFSDESAQLLYDRGNSYIRQNEYDKAETIFNQLLSLCPEDPEIYWDLVLCKYGVTFVQDGYVTNSKINNGLDSDWENIIQITPRFNTTNVALTNEGKVIYGNTQNELNPDWTDSWLQPTNEWTNIISLSCDLERFGFGGMESAALVGLKSDGTVVSVFYGVQPNADSFISSLKNIKEISVNVGVNGRVSIAALDKNGTLYTFADGVSNTYENLNIIDVETTDYYSDSDIESQFYILNNELTLSRLDSGNTIIEDAVYNKPAITLKPKATDRLKEKGLVTLKENEKEKQA